MRTSASTGSHWAFSRLINGDLGFLGRDHDRTDALDALAAARSIFPRVSADLIYARPNQNLAAWEAELETLLTHLGEHVSLYQLTIEKGTPFYGLYRSGALVPPDPDLAADLYALSQRKLTAAGYTAYEISIYARPRGHVPP